MQEVSGSIPQRLLALLHAPLNSKHHNKYDGFMLGTIHKMKGNFNFPGVSHEVFLWKEKKNHFW